MTSIAAERSALSRVGGPRLRRREEWKSRRSYTDSRTVVEPADHQFVHITITNPKNYSSNDAHARGVEAIGIARFPNTGISYNRLIMPNGAVYEGQPIGRRGAHTVNDKNRATCNTAGCPSRNTAIRDPRNNLNYNVRAYAFCQNVNDPVTNKQVDNIARVLAADILAGFVKRGATLHGHRCVAWKSCPADKVWARMDDIERLRDKYVRDGFEEGLIVTPEDAAQVRKIVREEIDRTSERNAKRAGEWADYLVWAHVMTNRIDGSKHPAWSFLTAAHKHAYMAEYRLGDVVPAPTENPNAEDNPTWYMQNAMGTVLDQVYSLKSRDAQMAAQMAAMQNAMEQLTESPGTPVDWDRVAEAAERGAESALSRVELVVAPAAELMEIEEFEPEPASTEPQGEPIDAEIVEDEPKA